MASAAARQFVLTAVDFETTGAVAGWDNEPWQIGMCEIASGCQIGEVYSSWLKIDIDRPFNEYAPGRHSQIRNRLAESPSLPELWDVVSPWLLRHPLVAHNIGTEKTILRKAAPLNRLGPWIDTLKLARYIYPTLKSYALEDLIDQLGLKAKVDSICPDLSPHDALYDAVACAQLLIHFLSLPGWEDVTIDSLCAI